MSSIRQATSLSALVCIILALGRATSGSILPANFNFRPLGSADRQSAAENLTLRRSEDDSEETTNSRIASLLSRIEKIREVRRDSLRDLQENVLDRWEDLRHGRGGDPQIYRLAIDLPIAAANLEGEPKTSDTLAGRNSPNSMVQYDDSLENDESQSRRTRRSFPGAHSAFELVPDYNQHSYFSHPLVTDGPRLRRLSRQVTTDTNLAQVLLDSNQMVAHQEPAHYDDQRAEIGNPIVLSQQVKITPGSAPDNMESDSIWRSSGELEFGSKRSERPNHLGPSLDEPYPPSAVHHYSDSPGVAGAQPSRFDDTSDAASYRTRPRPQAPEHQSLSAADSYGHEMVSLGGDEGGEYSRMASQEKLKCDQKGEEEEEEHKVYKAKPAKKIVEKEHHHYHHHHHHHEAKKQKKEEKKYPATQPVHLEIRIEGKSKSKAKAKGKAKGKDKEKAKGKEGEKVYIKFAQGHTKSSGQQSEKDGYEQEEYSKADGAIEDKKSLLGDEDSGQDADQGNEGKQVMANMSPVEKAEQRAEKINREEGSTDIESDENQEARHKGKKEPRTASSEEQMGHVINTSQVPNHYFDINDESQSEGKKKEGESEVQIEEQIDENKKQEVKKEEPKKEEKKEVKVKKKSKKHEHKQEAKNEEKKQEAPKEEVKQEEVKQQDVKKDGEKQVEQPVAEIKHKEEPKKEEAKKEEPKKEQPKKEEPKKEEPKKEEPRREHEKDHKKEKHHKKSKHNHIELHEHKHFEHHQHINLHKPQYEEMPQEVDVNQHENLQHQLEGEHDEPIDLGMHQGYPQMHHEPIPIKEQWIVPEIHEKPKSEEHPHGAFVIEDTSELERHHISGPEGVGYQEDVINHPHGLGLNPSGYFSLMGAYSSPGTTHTDRNSTSSTNRQAAKPKDKVRITTSLQTGKFKQK